MKNDWILDVLADLTAFAEKNGLVRLEHQLRAASTEAAVDLGSSRLLAERASKAGHGHAGIFLRTPSTGPDA